MQRANLSLHQAVESNNLIAVRNIISAKKRDLYQSFHDLYADLLSGWQAELASIERQFNSRIPASVEHQLQTQIRHIMSQLEMIQKLKVNVNDFGGFDNRRLLNSRQGEIKARVDEIKKQIESLEKRKNDLEYRQGGRRYGHSFSIDSASLNIREAMENYRYEATKLEGLNAGLQVLIDQIRKIDLDKRNNENLTPLQIATIKGYGSVFDCLIEHGADYFVCTLNRNNLLHLAVENGHRNIAGRLIRLADFNLSIANADGFTPLEIALNKGDFFIAEKLLRQSKQLEDILNIKRFAVFHGVAVPAYVVKYFDEVIKLGSLTPSMVLSALKSLYLQNSFKQAGHPVQHTFTLADLNLESSVFIEMWPEVEKFISLETTMLDLSNNQLDKESLFLLDEWLRVNTSLLKLNLSGNKSLGGAGLVQVSAIEHLARVLEHHPCLKELNLANTGLNDYDIKSLFGYLSLNTSLKLLDISSNLDVTSEIGIYLDEMLKNRGGQAQLTVLMEGNPQLNTIKEDFSNINCLPLRNWSHSTSPNIMNAQQKQALDRKVLDQVKNPLSQLFKVYRTVANVKDNYDRKDMSAHEKFFSGVKNFVTLLPEALGFGKLISGGSHAMEMAMESAELVKGLIEVGEEVIEAAESSPSSSKAWELVHEFIHTLHTLSGKAQVDARLKTISAELSGSHNKEKSEFLAEVCVHHYKEQILLLPPENLSMFINLIRMHVDRFLREDTSKTINADDLVRWLARAKLDQDAIVTLNNHARVLLVSLLQGSGLKLLDAQQNEIKIDLQIKQLESDRWVQTNGKVYGYREIDKTTLKLLLQMIRDCKEGTEAYFNLDFIRISNATLNTLQNAPRPLQVRECKFKTMRERMNTLEGRVNGVEDTLQVLNQDLSSVRTGAVVRALEGRVAGLKGELTHANIKIKEIEGKNIELKNENEDLKEGNKNLITRVERLEAQVSQLLQLQQQANNLALLVNQQAAPVPALQQGVANVAMPGNNPPVQAPAHRARNNNPAFFQMNQAGANQAPAAPLNRARSHTI